MNLLISTESADLFVVAVGNEKIERVRVVRKKYKHSELLLREIDKLISETKIKNIFVVCGPGGFSALRIGLAVANTLVYGFNCQIVGIEIKATWSELEESARLEKIWQSGMRKLKNKKTNKIKFIEPIYGREPHITVKKQTRGGQDECID